MNADKLEPGTCFLGLGKWRLSDYPERMVLVEFRGERTLFRRVKIMDGSAGYFPPEDIKVIEKYGIGVFHEPEGKE